MLDSKLPPTNVVSSSAVIANPANVSTASQPNSGASMIVKTSAVIDVIDSSRPRRSIRGTFRSRDSGTTRNVAMTVMITIGTLMKKTEPHQKFSSSQPPLIGPAATPTPLVALHIPMALARSEVSVNMLVMMARVAGKIPAAPIPMSARPTINSPALSAEPANADVTPKITNPVINARLRPNRSPRAPAARSRPAKTRR